jgi:hypothetical protein
MEATVQVTKHLTHDGEDIEAINQTFYVALFEDEELTESASEVKAIEFHNAAVSTVEFTGLEVGKNYYVAEVDETGEPTFVGVVNDVIYTAEFENGNEATVYEEGDVTVVVFDNEFMEIPEGFYKAADLTITKQVRNADGSPKNTDEVFYAGIFDDPEFTTLSQHVEAQIVELDLAGGSEVSQTIEIELPLGEGYTLYVTEVNEDGVPVSSDAAFAYTVTMDNSEVVLGEENLSASVTIINQEKPAATPTETPTPAPTATPTPETEQTPGVKTGDDTPVDFYLMLFGMAAVVMVFAADRRRREKNTK